MVVGETGKADEAMTEYGAKLAKRAMTQNEVAIAEQAIRGAQEAGCKVSRR